jgi:hypothetical protein
MAVDPALSYCEVQTRPGRGRGVFLKEHLAAGADVIAEPPLLLTVAFEVLQSYCSQCLRRLPSFGHLQCLKTRCACFCCEQCQSDAERHAGSPSLALRQQLARISWTSLSSEDAHHVYFVLQLTAVQLAAAAGDPNAQGRLQAFLDLAPCGQVLARKSHHQRILEHVRSALEQSAHCTVDHVAQYLARDIANSFGIEAPESAHGDLKLRGSALYAQASMVNHSCLPTVARVDHFDSDLPNRTHIRLCTLHALPSSEEVLLSYTPLHWSLLERQSQCQEVYGFQCSCLRCMSESKEAGQECCNQLDGLEDGVDETFIQLFLLKYLCTQLECFGTYVPFLNSTDELSQCNVCGHRRTEADFLRDLDEA